MDDPFEMIKTPLYAGKIDSMLLIQALIFLQKIDFITKIAARKPRFIIVALDILTLYPRMNRLKSIELNFSALGIQ